MAESRFRGAPPPPRHPVPTYPVLRPQKDGPLDVTILDDSILGIVTHWVLSDVGGVGSTMVCTQHEGRCQYHDDRLEWCGFVAVWDHGTRKRAVLRLGPKDADVLAKTLGVDLRWTHVRVKITPTNAGKGKTIHVSRVEHEAPAKIARHEIERTVCLVLACDHIPLQSSGPDPSEIPVPPEGDTP